MANSVLFTRELYDAAVDFACEFNEYVVPERVVSGSPAAPSDATGDRPGDDFNRRARWEDVLEPHGWRKCRVSGSVTYWTRPGKDPRMGCSATTGKCSTEASGDLLYNFSGSSDKMDAHTCYAKFAAYTLLEHGGDYSAAARALRDQGFGGDGQSVHIGEFASGADAPPPGEPQADGDPKPPPLWQYKWASELSEHQDSTEWLWEGYIPQNGVTLVSALWKAGKTTLLSHMLKAFGAGPTFLGQVITPCKVLYVTEEMERHWSRRRDELPLGDQVAFHVQPFTAKPNGAHWAALVRQLVDDVKSGGFQLVVFDTLADLWPVVKENDAGEVQAALTVLRQINKAGAAVLMVHHLRKGGGTEYTGSRGSGVLGSFPDILVEMSRVEATGGAPDNRRKLSAISRYEETPREMIVEWTKEGGFARVDHVADPTFGPPPVDETNRVRENRILAVLSDDPEQGLSQGDIDKAMKAKFGEGLGRKERWDSYLIPMLTDRRIALVSDIKGRQYYKVPNGSGSQGSDPLHSEEPGTGNL